MSTNTKMHHVANLSAVLATTYRLSSYRAASAAIALTALANRVADYHDFLSMHNVDLGAQIRKKEGFDRNLAKLLKTYDLPPSDFEREYNTIKRFSAGENHETATGAYLSFR